mmetsp:Transcript_2959/g.9695  ORF Transcript_2959/g.9695 Transcript_2959/m.9695 type:complete len:237 (+) Transcript_2959:1139-1849(+)
MSGTMLQTAARATDRQFDSRAVVVAAGPAKSGPTAPDSAAIADRLADPCPRTSAPYADAMRRKRAPDGSACGATASASGQARARAAASAAARRRPSRSARSASAGGGAGGRPTTPEKVLSSVSSPKTAWASSRPLRLAPSAAIVRHSTATPSRRPTARRCAAAAPDDDPWPVVPPCSSWLRVAAMRRASSTRTAAAAAISLANLTKSCCDGVRPLSAASGGSAARAVSPGSSGASV